MTRVHISDYSAALAWLLSLPDWERGTGDRPAKESLLLARPSALVQALGDPQTGFRSILVAGTKGKGSTAAILESVLRASGFKTGLYTSPHLHSYRERIRVSGELISESEFSRGAGELQPIVGDLVTGHPSFQSFSTFEVMTALALKHFADSHVDVAILEVGIGGRLDATNVVAADLSLITPISYDHMAVLGNALPKIATEKAGIIKPGKIVLSAPQQPEVLAVIEQTANQRGAVLGVGERDWLWLGGHDDFMVAGEPRAGLWKNYWHYRDMHVPLLGTHQFVNAGLAVAAVELIRQQWGKKIDAAGIGAGLAQARWAGRLEVLQSRSETGPLMVADGAHNGDSAEKLFDALRFHFKFDRLFLIVGVLGDKELDAIARPFVIATEFAWTITTSHPRSRSAEGVAAELKALGMNARPAATMKEAITDARKRAGPRDLILVTGSLSIVAQARQAMGLAKAQDPEL